MIEVFKIASVAEDGSIFLFEPEYAAYTDAQAAIEILGPGLYQIQKYFLVK